ncbi:MAG: SRPBCC family protein [Acidimicrobiia bacterium]|nr:SRPBCC family protein [Acidimicrobiia bacterium]
MEIVRTLDAPGPPERLFALLDDLDEYRRWMPLIHGVTRAETRPGDRLAWDVELRAKVGPFARSKRLRMVRTEWDSPRRVVFEREELDGREHAAWVLQATIDELPTTDCHALTMSLHYGGGLWTGVALQRVLDHDVEVGSRNLVELLSSEPTR